MKGKILGIGAMVIVLLLSFSLPAFALYNISVPFSDSSFDLLSMSYYLDEAGEKVAFGSGTGTWMTSPTTAMQFYVPGCTGIVPAFRFSSGGEGNAWNAGEIMTINMTITDLSASAEFETDPTQYRIVLQSGSYSVNFTASSATYSATGSGGYQEISVVFSATQTLQSSIPVYGAVFQFYLPFHVSASGTSQYIQVDFGNLRLASTDGLENINTEKVVDAIEGAVVEDFGYTTPEDQSSNMDSLGQNIDDINGWIDDLNSFKSDYADVFTPQDTDNSAYSFLWCWFDISWLSALVLMFSLFLLFRKIIK